MSGGYHIIAVAARLPAPVERGGFDELENVSEIYGAQTGLCLIGFHHWHHSDLQSECTVERLINRRDFKAHIISQRTTATTIRHTCQYILVTLVVESEPTKLAENGTK